MELVASVKKGWAIGLLVGLMLQTAAVAESECENVRSISVVGKGEVQRKPDVARSNLGIQVAAASVREAMETNRRTMARIQVALDKLGIEEKDIATSNFSIHYQQPRPKEDIPGQYQVSNMLEVTIRDLEKVDGVLDGATRAGANQVWGVRFVLDNIEEAQDQARTLAVRQAERKALELAELHQVRLGPVLRISEEGSSPEMRPVFARSSAVSEGGVSPGQLSFSARIHVVYAIEAIE